jgi:hypothetical protein
MSQLKVNSIIPTAGVASDSGQQVFGGGVVQIIQNKQYGRTTTSSNTFVETDNNVVITPTSSSSKIYVLCSGDCNTEADRVLIPTLYRKIGSGSYSNIAPQGSNDTFGSNTNNGFLYINSPLGRIQVPWTISFFDVPNTTDQITYKIYVRTPSGGNIEFPANNQYNPVCMTAMEVSA